MSNSTQPGLPRWKSLFDECPHRDIGPLCALNPDGIVVSFTCTRTYFSITHCDTSATGPCDIQTGKCIPPTSEIVVTVMLWLIGTFLVLGCLVAVSYALGMERAARQLKWISHFKQQDEKDFELVNIRKGAESLLRADPVVQETS